MVQIRRLDPEHQSNYLRWELTLYQLEIKPTETGFTVQLFFRLPRNNLVLGEWNAGGEAIHVNRIMGHVLAMVGRLHRLEMLPDEIPYNTAPGPYYENGAFSDLLNKTFPIGLHQLRVSPLELSFARQWETKQLQIDGIVRHLAVLPNLTA